MHSFKLFSTAAALVAAAAAVFTGDITTQEWDIIVVGAGPAGLIVGDRMSAAGLKTLIIEQGGYSYGLTGGDLSSRRPGWLNGTDLSRVDVPGLYKSIFATPGDLVCNSTKVNAFIGCTIGGCTAINAGLFFEPPSSDYDLYFPEGWHSQDMKAATARLYAMQPSTDSSSGNGVRYEQSGYNAAKKWLVDGVGYDNVEINAQADDKTRVFGRPVFDYNHGQRGGPTTTYLQSAIQRENFHLQINTHVVRVEREGDRATGVTVLYDGVQSFVRLSNNGRVISSGGAIQSPALLMASGIGEPKTLASLEAAGKLSPNINSQDWINTTAVGDGLFDNPNTFIELQGDSIQSYVYTYDNPPVADQQLYLNNRSGPYSFASETSVFWDSVTHADGSQTAFQGTIDSAGFDDYMSNQTITLNVYGTSGLKSSGRVVFDSNFVPGPDGNVYYSNYQDVIDIAGFIHGIFQGLPGSGLTPLNLAQNSTQLQIETYINSTTAYTRGEVQHWSSSCRIGKCVDVNAQVIGMKNLHVVDASIIEPLTVNPQFGTMVAAEKASEQILKLMGRPLVSSSLPEVCASLKLLGVKSAACISL